MIKVSNQTSADAFLDYLKKHPEIEEVYGIIGLGHIGFLDEYAINIEKTDNQSHLYIKITDRKINVHLFGG